MNEGTCVVCGKVIGRGSQRCILHRGQETRRRTLIETTERDRVLLLMVDDEHLTGQRIADRLGVSRTQAYQKVKLARFRQRARAKMTRYETIVTEGVPHGSV